MSKKSKLNPPSLQVVSLTAASFDLAMEEMINYVMGTATLCTAMEVYYEPAWNIHVVWLALTDFRCRDV